MHLVLWVLFLVYVLLVIRIFTTGFVKKEFDIRDAEARIFANRLLYSPNGISYIEEDLGRSYPWTVDLAKIDSSFLDSAFKLDDNQVLAAKITVTSTAGNVMKEAVYNEVWYYRWLPLMGKRGTGASSVITEKRYVLVYEGGEFKGQGILEMQILIPNA